MHTAHICMLTWIVCTKWLWIIEQRRDTQRQAKLTLNGVVWSTLSVIGPTFRTCCSASQCTTQCKYVLCLVFFYFQINPYSVFAAYFRFSISVSCFSFLFAVCQIFLFLTQFLSPFATKFAHWHLFFTILRTMFSFSSLFSFLLFVLVELEAELWCLCAFLGSLQFCLLLFSVGHWLRVCKRRSLQWNAVVADDGSHGDAGLATDTFIYDTMYCIKFLCGWLYSLTPFFICECQFLSNSFSSHTKKNSIYMRLSK